MKVVVTGGLGFVGRALARRLGALGAEVVLVDRLPADDVSMVDVGDAEAVREVIGPDVDVVFHLASVVSGQGEIDFDGAMRVNLEGTRNVLEACRLAQTTPRLVFASTMTLPSRRTGIAMADNVSSAPFDARSCSGNAI